MRSDDTYETERPAEGRDHTGHQAGGEHRQDKDPPCRCARKGGILFSEQDEVQAFSVGHGQDQPNQERHGHQGGLEVAVAGKASCHPAVEQFQALFAGRVLQDGTQGAEDESQHDAEYQQCRRGPEPG